MFIFILPHFLFSFLYSFLYLFLFSFLFFFFYISFVLSFSFSFSSPAFFVHYFVLFFIPLFFFLIATSYWLSWRNCNCLVTKMFRIKTPSNAQSTPKSKPKKHKLQYVCDSLLTTSLSQVVNRFVACQNLFSADLLQVVSTSCNKSANDNLQQVCGVLSCIYKLSLFMWLYSDVYGVKRRIKKTRS